MFKRNTKVLLGNLNLGQAGAELGTTALVVLDLLVPELTMSQSPGSINQQEEDEPDPLCSSPLSTHIWGTRQNREKLREFTSYPVEDLLCLCSCGRKKQSLTGCLKSWGLTRWTPGAVREMSIPNHKMVPLNNSWYQTSVTRVTWLFLLCRLLPSQPSSLQYCIFSLPHYVCLLQNTFPYASPWTLLLFISLWIFSAFAPKAQANQNLSCSTQASVTFQTPQRIPVWSQSGEPWHQKTGSMCKANWIYDYSFSPK